MTIIDQIYEAWRKETLNFSDLAAKLTKELSVKLTREDIIYVILTHKAPPEQKTRIDQMIASKLKVGTPKRPPERKGRRRKPGRPKKKR